jgi:hypothetical protein
VLNRHAFPLPFTTPPIPPFLFDNVPDTQHKHTHLPNTITTPHYTTPSALSNPLLSHLGWKRRNFDEKGPFGSLKAPAHRGEKRRRPGQRTEEDASNSPRRLRPGGVQRKGNEKQAGGVLNVVMMMMMMLERDDERRHEGTS